MLICWRRTKHWVSIPSCWAKVEAVPARPRIVKEEMGIEVRTAFYLAYPDGASFRCPNGRFSLARNMVTLFRGEDSDGSDATAGSNYWCGLLSVKVSVLGLSE
jgi:hypothetical protein